MPGVFHIHLTFFFPKNYFYSSSYLLAASGKTLSIIKIDAQTRILVSNTQYQMRWEIRSVSTFENRIVVGCQRDSLSFFDYDALNKKFEYLGSDQCSRLVNDSMIVSPQFAVGTDKAGNFFGLSCRHPLDAANPAVAAAAEAEMMGAEGGSSDNNGSGTGLSNVVQSPLAPPTTSKLTTAVPLDNNLVTEFSYNVGQAIVRLHRGNLAHVVESADGVFESMMMSTVSSNSNAGVRSHDPPSFTDSNNAAASDASGDDALFASLLSIRPEELNLGWRGAATMQPVNPLRAHQPLAITGINGSQMDLDIGISPATPILSSPPQQHPTHRASLSSPVFLSPGGQASSDPFSPIAAFSPPSAGSGMQMGSSPWSFQPVAESIAHNVLPFSRVDNETIVTSAATTRSPKSISSSIIYGSTMLGSVFAFIQIGADALVKLRLLQHILAIDPATRPLLGNDHAAFRSNRNCYQTTEISSTLSSKTAATGRTLNGQSSKSGGGGGGSGWKRSSEVHQQQQLLLDETGAVLDGELLTMFVGLGLETQLGIARKWVDLATGKNGDNNNNININSTTNKTTTSSLFAKLKPSIGKENDLLYRSRIEAARRMLVLTIEHLNKKCI